ncbi:hypothetical protein Areg01_21690 [Actinoplanes regularis]|nr:hypothetical protein Areg01_21690 [Actinoplanes regularis]
MHEHRSRGIRTDRIGDASHPAWGPTGTRPSRTSSKPEQLFAQFLNLAVRYGQRSAAAGTLAHWPNSGEAADDQGRRRPDEPPDMSTHTCSGKPFVTTMLDAGVSLCDVQIAARHADPRTTIRYDRARKTSTATPTTSSPHSWPLERNRRERPTMPMRGRRAVGVPLSVEGMITA